MTDSSEAQAARLAGEMVSGALMEVYGAVSGLGSDLAWAEYRELRTLWDQGNLNSEVLRKRLGYLHNRLSHEARSPNYKPFDVVENEDPPAIEDFITT